MLKSVVVLCGWFLVSGCSSMKLKSEQVIPMPDVRLEQPVVIRLKPFNKAAREKAYEGGYTTYSSAGGITSATTNKAVYRWDNNDYKALRESILASLKATSQFVSVEDEDKAGNAAPPSGSSVWNLRIEFEEVGLVVLAVPLPSTASIQAKAYLSAADGTVSREHFLNVKSSCSFCGPAAVNGVVQEFVTELQKLFNVNAQ